MKKEIISKAQYEYSLKICNLYLEQEKQKITFIKEKYEEIESAKFFKAWNTVKKGDKIKIYETTGTHNLKIQPGDITNVLEVYEEDKRIYVRIRFTNKTYHLRGWLYNDEIDDIMSRWKLLIID